MDRSVFTAVAPNIKLSDRVEEQIRQLIVTGKVPIGERLPPERELADIFGVSRTVVREAVRSLVAKGLLDIRSGSGTYVVGPQPGFVSDALSMLLQHSQRGYDDIHEIRMMIEVEIARLAAQRATPEEIGALAENVAAMESASDPAELAEIDVAFHELLAKATHNLLFSVMLGSITDIMLEIRKRSFTLRSSAPVAVRFHRDILGRVAARDADGAMEAMRAHLADSYLRMQGREGPEGADAE